MTEGLLQHMFMEMNQETSLPILEDNIKGSTGMNQTQKTSMYGRFTGNYITTTVEELMHFHLWGTYCKLMNLEKGAEDPKEVIVLPNELMELMGI